MGGARRWSTRRGRGNHYDNILRGAGRPEARVARKLRSTPRGTVRAAHPTLPTRRDPPTLVVHEPPSRPEWPHPLDRDRRGRGADRGALRRLVVLPAAAARSAREHTGRGNRGAGRRDPSRAPCGPRRLGRDQGALGGRGAGLRPSGSERIAARDLVRFANAERCTCGCGYTPQRAAPSTRARRAPRVRALLDSVSRAHHEYRGRAQTAGLNVPRAHGRR